MSTVVYKGFRIASVPDGWAVLAADGSTARFPTRRAARAYCDRHVVPSNWHEAFLLRVALDEVLGHESITAALGCLQKRGVPDEAATCAIELAHWAFCPERVREPN